MRYPGNFFNLYKVPANPIINFLSSKEILPYWFISIFINLFVKEVTYYLIVRQTFFFFFSISFFLTPFVCIFSFQFFSTPNLKKERFGEGKSRNSILFAWLFDSDERKVDCGRVSFHINKKDRFSSISFSLILPF